MGIVSGIVVAVIIIVLVGLFVGLCIDNLKELEAVIELAAVGIFFYLLFATGIGVIIFFAGLIFYVLIAVDDVY